MKQRGLQVQTQFDEGGKCLLSPSLFRRLFALAGDKYRGKKVWVGIWEAASLISVQQMRYYRGVVVKMIVERYIQLGIHTNADRVHYSLKCHFLGVEKFTDPMTGEEKETPISTKTIKRDELFEVYIDPIREWAREELELSIPDPKTSTFLPIY